MQNTVIPFPSQSIELVRPSEVSRQALHLDVVATILADRGFRAKAGMYVNRLGEECAGLSTDAPPAEVAAAFIAAHAHLCIFLVEELGVGSDDLPALRDMQPHQTINARSGYRGGRVFGYA